VGLGKVMGSLEAVAMSTRTRRPTGTVMLSAEVGFEEDVSTIVAGVEEPESGL
jgi:hypothetical protein